MWSRVGKFDQWLFDRVATASLPGFERALPQLSRAADHSLLWFGIASGLAGSRQARLRRAALRGVTGIAIASPAVNLIGKQLFRRARPRIDMVPPIRIRWHLPTSPAFPSGHSASAAAFATCVAMEAPKLVSLPVFGLAAGVAVSRIYTGAHYPGDVLAGVLMGVSAGVLTRVVWPVRPSRPALHVVSEPSRETGGAGPLIVVVNTSASASPAFAWQIRAAARLLPQAEVIETGDTGQLDRLLDHAARRAGVLAVAGGDGTVRAGAQAALRHGVPLLPVPGGSLNHFARALGIESVSDALAAYRGGTLGSVDVGVVRASGDGGDEIFLNAASFGVYADLVEHREHRQGRLGKWPALAVSGASVLRHSQPVDVVIGGRLRRTWLGFVGNCRYASRGVAPTWRLRLDDGLLDVRLVACGSRRQALAAMLAGHLRMVRGYLAWRSSHVRAEFAPGDHQELLVLDGETVKVSSAVTFGKLPGALKVVLPS